MKSVFFDSMVNSVKIASFLRLVMLDLLRSAVVGQCGLFKLLIVKL